MTHSRTVDAGIDAAKEDVEMGGNDIWDSCAVSFLKLGFGWFWKGWHVDVVGFERGDRRQHRAERFLIRRLEIPREQFQLALEWLLRFLRACRLADSE